MGWGLLGGGALREEEASTSGEGKQRVLQAEGTAQAKAERWASQGVFGNQGSRRVEEEEVEKSSQTSIRRCVPEGSLQLFL